MLKYLKSKILYFLFIKNKDLFSKIELSENCVVGVYFVA